MRLADLPGEREGRHYYFRRVSLGAIAAQASRRIWTDRVQQTLAPSIFRIVQRLRQALPPAVGAAIILASLSHSAPAILLDTLPVSWIRDWLREMENGAGGPAPASPVALPGSLQATLRLAAQQFGWKEPRTVWLAALGVMAHAPTPAAAHEVLRRARATLQQMAQEQAREPLDRGASIIRGNDAKLLRFTSDAALEAARAVAAAAEYESLTEPQAPAAAAPQAARQPPRAAGKVVATALLGEPTAAAGLYFLLHVLRQLGIVDALAASPALADACFAVHILGRLAAHARVGVDDPIRHCLDLETADFAIEGPFTDVRLWPRNWPAERRRGDGRALLRIWSIAVRRWCRRTAGLTVRDIVTRGGRVWLTRTDLDVTLPLTALDVRIRRIGLDIDPGWLPWLGRLGRVVRFHYRDPRPHEAAG